VLERNRHGGAHPARLARRTSEQPGFTPRAVAWRGMLTFSRSRCSRVLVRPTRALASGGAAAPRAPTRRDVLNDAASGMGHVRYLYRPTTV
jgi:hypothetical protein